PRDFLAFLGLEVEDGAALAAVEEQEEIAVGIGVVGVPQPPRAVAVRWALDLDDVGAEPGQHLGAGRARLVVGEIDDANTVEGATHLRSPGVGEALVTSCRIKRDLR